MHTTRRPVTSRRVRPPPHKGPGRPPPRPTRRSISPAFRTCTTNHTLERQRITSATTFAAPAPGTIAFQPATSGYGKMNDRLNFTDNSTPISGFRLPVQVTHPLTRNDLSRKSVPWKRLSLQSLDEPSRQAARSASIHNPIHPELPYRPQPKRCTFHFEAIKRAFLISAILTPLPALATNEACSRSTILLPIHLPVQSISDQLNSIAPKKLSGSKGNPVDFLSRDSLTWSVSRGPINVSARNNALQLNTRLSARVTIRGKIKGFIGRHLPTVQETLDRIRADVDASIAPRLTENWRIQPNLRANVHLRQASGKIAGIRYSVRRHLQGPLNDAVNKEIRHLNAKISENKKLKSEVEKLWREFHRTILLHEEPPIWLSVIPRRLSASTFQINDQRVSVSIGIAADTSLATGTRPELPLADFPRLTLVGHQPEGHFALALPAFLKWKDVDRQILRNISQKPPVIDESSARLTLTGLSLSGTEEGRMVATGEFSVNPTDMWGRVLAWIDGLLVHLGLKWNLSNALERQVVQLTVVPNLDASGTRLSLRNPTLTDSSSELVKNAARVYEWINNEKIETLIERNAIVDLSREMKRGNERAQDELGKLMGEFSGRGIDLNAEILNVTKLDSLRVTSEGLLTKLCAAATVSMEVRQLGKL